MIKDPKSGIPLPPDEFVLAVGGGDFFAIGQHFFKIFVNQGGLLPNHKVLDVGSGCGRMAIPLTSYLERTAEYCGIDIVEPMVQWCVENISSLYPNFKFQHVKLKNSLYSQEGETAASYKFPFPDEYFDFVFLTSVFTHLNPQDTENYLREIKRVLKNEGRVLMTFYVITKEYPAKRRNNRALVTFDHGSYPYWINDPNVPEAVSAYEETYIFREIRNSGLSIDNIYYGQWNGNKNRLSWQDVIIATRNDLIANGEIFSIRKFARSAWERVAYFFIRDFRRSF